MLTSYFLKVVLFCCILILPINAKLLGGIGEAIGRLFTTKATTKAPSTTSAPSAPNCIPYEYTNSGETSVSSTGPIPYCSQDGDEVYKGQYIKGTSDRKTFLPLWANLTLASQGQKFASGNSFYFFFGSFYLLIFGFPELAISDTLTFTQSSDTPDRAIKRYLAVATQTLVWYEADLTNSVQREIFLTSIENVREMHIMAANAANKRLDAQGGEPLVPNSYYENYTTDETLWSAFENDLNNSSIVNRAYPQTYTDSVTGENKKKFRAINQYYQGIVAMGFMGMYIWPEKFHIIGNDEEWRGFMHLWAIISYALGVDDQYNICLKKDLKAINETLYTHLLEIGYPSLFTMDKRSKVLTESIITALGQTFVGILPMGNLHVAIYHLMEKLFGIPMPSVKKLITGLDLLNYELMEVVMTQASHNDLLKAVVMNSIRGVYGLIIQKTFGPTVITHRDYAEHVYYSNLNASSSS